MNLFATLLLAHLIADFPLQTNGLYRLKRRHLAGVLLHSGIHCLITAILIKNPLANWPMLVTLFAFHVVIDWVKLRVEFKFYSLGFLLDQLAHLLALLVITAWASASRGVLPPVILYPALAYALVPGLLMFLSVLAIDLERLAHNPVWWPKLKAPQIVMLSHLVGYPLVVGIVIMRFGGWV
jgi:hypothetical protein